jgi:hypothetical protein
MTYWTTLLKKKKVIVLYILVETCDPYTCVDVRAELGDALCNLVVLPTL